MGVAGTVRPTNADKGASTQRSVSNFISKKENAGMVVHTTVREHMFQSALRLVSTYARAGTFSRAETPRRPSRTIYEP